MLLTFRWKILNSFEKLNDRNDVFQNNGIKINESIRYKTKKSIIQNFYIIKIL